MGFLELLTIAFIILLVFGSNRLPGVARGLGKAIKNFKDAAQKPSSSHKDD